MRNILLEPKNLKGKLILNKFKKDEGLYNREHIEFLLSENVEFTFSFSEEGWEKENEKETLMMNKMYFDEMNNFSKLILKEFDKKVFVDSVRESERGILDEKTGKFSRNKRRVFFR